FVASHLIDYILSNEPNVTIHGTVRRGTNTDNIRHSIDQIHTHDVELTDFFSVEKAIKKIDPDRIFHMGAQSYVPASWNGPKTTMEVNVCGTLNILEACKDCCGRGIIISGSSEEYGMVFPIECPINESQPLRPLSPYGVSKVAADKLGYQYANSYDMNVLVTRAFNMTGPRRGEMFVDSNFAKQIVSLEKTTGMKEIYHGNLDAIRDFTDVRDSVRAFWYLSNKKWNGQAVNVCTGEGHRIEDVLNTLISLSPIRGEVSCVLDPKRNRPSDVPRLIGSNKKLKSIIDWDPTYRWEDSLKDLLNYWRFRSDVKNVF
ncbi:MAG: GDP-mannose 4,6-dehydratase, partial [Candidatus Dojkabacteria bacterium]